MVEQDGTCWAQILSSLCLMSAIIAGLLEEAGLVKLSSIVKSSRRLHLGLLYHHSSSRLSSWVCLFCWLRILMSLYWLCQIHLATQFPELHYAWPLHLALLFCSVCYFTLLHCCLFSLLSSFLFVFSYLACIVLLLPVFPFCDLPASCSPPAVTFDKTAAFWARLLGFRSLPLHLQVLKPQLIYFSMPWCSVFFGFKINITILIPISEGYYKE